MVVRNRAVCFSIRKSFGLKTRVDRKEIIVSNTNEFREYAKGFLKSPLGIIGLFVVFVHCIASLVVISGKGLECDTLFILICFIVLFPLIVFCGFVWLVVNHHNKLYGPSDFRDDESFLKLQLLTIESLVQATVMRFDTKENKESLQKQLKEIFEVLLKTNEKKKQKNSKNKILWVDDEHNNNIYERQAFESKGIKIDISATNTEEALELLNDNKYIAIISDMKREEGDEEGYVLLEEIRKMHINTPFFIYTHSASQEDLKTTYKKGGQGITDRPDKLYEMVMNKIGNECR